MSYRRLHGPVLRFTLLAGLAAIGAGVPPATAADAPASDPVLDEYHERLDALDPDNLVDRYQLAIWCKDHDRLELAAAQCKAILKIDPDHTQAKLLLHIAEPPKDAARPPSRDRANRRLAPEIPRVTPKDVQRLRFAEIRLPQTATERLRPEPFDRVPVQFDSRVPQRFWERMQGRVGFTEKTERVEFFKMSPVQQLGLIAAHTGWEFQPDVQIAGDPKVFATFKTRIWPMIKTNCTTSGCHGGINPASFRFLADQPAVPEVIYANFLILDTITVDADRMIDRDRPDDSLLLTYALPQDKSLKPHPSPPEIKSILRNREDPRYNLLADWILSLRNPHPDYGVELVNFPQHLRPPPSILDLDANAPDNQ